MMKQIAFGWTAICLTILGLACFACGAGMSTTFAQEPEQLELCRFDVDVTPPLGTQCAYKVAERILDPLHARGVILLGADGGPIVLCAVDILGIANRSHDFWRETIAKAAGTTPQRVTVHALHQHDAPRTDFSSEALLSHYALGGKHTDPVFDRQIVQKVGEAVRQALEHRTPITHLGLGQATVEKIASNRRVLGEDGKISLMRMSSTRNKAMIEAPEGIIDPKLKLIAFYNQDKPVAALTYYACHPQSWYNQGDVSADYVGLARAQRDLQQPETLHVHFNGAGGDVAAGKYNDGSKENRPVLTQRLATAMEQAWNNIEKQPLSAQQVQWRYEPFTLPVGAHLDEQALRSQLANAELPLPQRYLAARHLAFLTRMQSGHQIEAGCLQLGDSTYILHMPGELFVEYQLAAQQMQPKGFVAMAAYGDYGPGYIGTEISYEQGGYEVQPSSSRTAPSVEKVLHSVMKNLLQADAN